MLALKQPRMLINWRIVVRWLSTARLPARTHISGGFSTDSRHESLSALRPHDRSPLAPTSFLPSLR